MPRSILHVAQPLDGGIPRVVSDLVVDQIARGWAVSVACPAESRLQALALTAGARCLRWDAERAPRMSTLVEVRRLMRVVGEVRPDLVHLHSAKAGLAGRLGLRGRLPTVFEPNAWSFEAANRLRPAVVAWERRAARWSDVLLCVSESERRQGEAAGVRGRYVVALNGVNVRAFSPATDAERSTARTRLGLSTAPLAVLVGRLCAQKGQDVIVDAWAAVRARVPGARLALVGDGPMRTALEGRACPGVTLEGARDDVADWLVAANVVVQPSRWEGMSLALLEALASSRGVVVTDVEGMREVVGTQAGAVVTPGDRAGLVDAVARRLAEPEIADAEGRAGRALVEASHDVRDTTARVADLYDAVLERRR